MNIDEMFTEYTCGKTYVDLPDRWVVLLLF